MPTNRFHSAGIILHRQITTHLEVLLLHPGGPFWAKKDAGAWSIPKGLVEEGETPPAAARREFAEELGLPPPEGEMVPLGEFRLPSRKIVTAFALRGDLDPADTRPGTFTMEWPPKSGKMATFPEADRCAWFTLDAAAEKITRGQLPILAALRAHLAGA
ncbi:MAG TPA: NUDIX domain-containing protein [Bryobacteraceae bacterium]|nr:NUDIX domain-containing protein [Bryobacteraceae bacterium]HVY18892.1 NUDIX domain-containing protein [Bauldia sp.]